MSHALTKRELREQRSAQRRAAEQAEAAHALRLKRLRRLAIAAGLAVAVLAVAISVSSSNDTKRSPADAAALFAGIPEHGGVLGDPSAPVTVTEYVDLQCPICAEASRATLPAVDPRLRAHRQGQAAGAHAALHRPRFGARGPRRRRRRAPGPAVAVPGGVLRRARRRRTPAT